MAEACGIDLEITDKEDKDFMDRIEKYIQRGWLVINDDGQGVYKLRGSVRPFESVTFKEPTGRIMKALDEMGESKYQTGMLAFLAAMAGTTQGIMSKLMNRDLVVMKDVSMLFLG